MGNLYIKKETIILKLIIRLQSFICYLFVAEFLESHQLFDQVLSVISTVYQLLCFPPQSGLSAPFISTIYQLLSFISTIFESFEKKKIEKQKRVLV